MPSSVPVDPSTLLGEDGYAKMCAIAFYLCGGLGYEGFHKWLAMWPDVDTALAEAKRSAGGEFT